MTLYDTLYAQEVVKRVTTSSIEVLHEYALEIKKIFSLLNYC